MNMKPEELHHCTSQFPAISNIKHGCVQNSEVGKILAPTGCTVELRDLLLQQNLKHIYFVVSKTIKWIASENIFSSQFGGGSL
jgi:hypothetical protein